MKYTCKKYSIQSGKKWIICFLISLCYFLSPAQSSRKFYAPPQPKLIESIGIRSGFGVIIPHRESMVHLVTGHVISNEIYFEKIGAYKRWNKMYRFPSTGVNLYYGYLSSEEVLGSAFALDYYANLHLIKRKKFLFDIRLASGLGYLTKTFDPQENNHNVAIGSHMNISVGASFDMKFQLSRYWQLTTGLSLKHFSNGSFSTPNLGINIPVWMVGIKRALANNILHKEYGSADTSLTNSYKRAFRSHQIYTATVGLGAKEIYPAGGNRYGTYSLELNATHYISCKSGFSAGADVIHNVALYKHAIQNDTLTELKQSQFTQFTFHIGYVQVFDNFELFLQNGFYIINKYRKDGNVYQRLGGRYRVNKWLSVQFALKTHFAKADYFEIGLGYYFDNDKNKEYHTKF